MSWALVLPHAEQRPHPVQPVPLERAEIRAAGKPQPVQVSKVLRTWFPVDLRPPAWGGGERRELGGHILRSL